METGNGELENVKGNGKGEGIGIGFGIGIEMGPPGSVIVLFLESCM